MIVGLPRFEITTISSHPHGSCSGTYMGSMGIRHCRWRFEAFNGNNHIMGLNFEGGCDLSLLPPGYPVGYDYTRQISLPFFASNGYHNCVWTTLWVHLQLVMRAFVNNELDFNLYPLSKWERLFQTWEKLDFILEQPWNWKLEIKFRRLE